MQHKLKFFLLGSGLHISCTVFTCWSYAVYSLAPTYQNDPIFPSFPSFTRKCPHASIGMLMLLRAMEDIKLLL